MRMALDRYIEPSRPPEFSDDALALKFADTHAQRLRYVAAWGKWLVWDGRRWAADSTKLGFDLSRDVCREAAAEFARVSNGGKGVAIASAKTVAAVERMAKPIAV